jgi:uncharacterized membrane protein YtjA (UPF0391 family)
LIHGRVFQHKPVGRQGIIPLGQEDSLLIHTATEERGAITWHNKSRRIRVLPLGMPRRPPNLTLMLHYALIFCIIALVAAALGLGGVAGTALYIARILLLVFIVLFIVSLLKGRKPRI